MSLWSRFVVGISLAFLSLLGGGFRKMIRSDGPMRGVTRMCVCVLTVVVISFAFLGITPPAMHLRAQGLPPNPPHSTIPPIPAVAVAVTAATEDAATDAVGTTISQETGTANSATISAVEGVLSILYADDFESGGYERLFRLLRDDDPSIWLTMDDAWFDAQGGAPRFDGQRVRMTISDAVVGGEAATAKADPWMESQQVLTLDLQAEGSEGPVEAAAISAPGVSGIKTLRYINLLCKFSDRTSDLPSAGEIAAWSTGGLGSVSHYYDTISFGSLRIEFTTVTQWRTMPVRNADVPGKRAWIDAISEHCPQLFSAEVDFSRYDGVQFFTNGATEHQGYGGTAKILVGGSTLYMKGAWYAYTNHSRFDHVVVTHELGHSMGRMHSNNYDGDTNPYDNFWDLMSGTDYGVTNGRDPCWWITSEKGINRRLNCIADGMAAPHRLELGWIAPSRVYTLTAGTDATVRLDWLSLGGTTPNLVAIRIPIDEGNYFTVEARTHQTDSYDRMLPGTGVIIHEVIRNREEPAWQVGATTDQESLKGGGVWLPGETYTNERWKFSVQVLEQTETGFLLRLKHDGVPAKWKPDLRLSYAESSGSNGYQTLKYRISNLGGPGNNLTLKLEYAAGKPFWWPDDKPYPGGTLVLVEAIGATCSGGTSISCSVPNLPTGGTHLVTLNFFGTEDGDYKIKTTLSARDFAPTGTTHIVEISFLLSAMSDVAVQMTPPMSIYTGAPIAPEVIIRNIGKTAINTTVTITLPAAFTVTSVSLTKTKVEAECRVASPGVICTLPSMPHGARLGVRLQMVASPEYEEGPHVVEVAAARQFNVITLPLNDANATNNSTLGVLCGAYCSMDGSSGPVVYLSQVRSR